MQDADTSYNPLGYTPIQLWCLGLAAITAEYNGERHDLLKHGDRDRYDNVLRGWWDIHNRRTYLDSLEWVRKEGHRLMFADHWGEMLVTSEQEWEQEAESLRKTDPKAFNRKTLVRHYRRVIGAQGINAWDLGRVVLLARMAATCDYISESEAWETIWAEAQQAARLFSNWYQYAHSYLVGRQYAMGNLDDDNGMAYLRITHRLLSDPSSPWQRYALFGELNTAATPATAH